MSAGLEDWITEETKIDFLLLRLRVFESVCSFQQALGRDTGENPTKLGDFWNVRLAEKGVLVESPYPRQRTPPLGHRYVPFSWAGSRTVVRAW
jgi:hypothetical protein